MSDLLDRLEAAARIWDPSPISGLLREASGEIVLARDALTEIADELPESTHVGWLARKVLRPPTAQS